MAPSIIRALRKRADELELQAERAKSTNSRIVLLFGAIELLKIADAFDPTTPKGVEPHA